MLRVRGNSMNRHEVPGGRIENGDLVLVHRQSEAQTGDAVVALIDGEATIKRLTKGPGYLGLHPVSSDASQMPIVVKPSLVIQGVVRRVLKKGAELLTRTVDDDS